MNELFLDTNFLIALSLEDDALHERAVKLNKDNTILDKKCYISNNILNEVITVVGNKTKDLEIVQELYYTLKDSFILLNESDIPYFNDKVINKYLHFKCKLSFTDVGIIETMKDNNLKYLVTFDEEFKRSNEIEIIK